ncbi:MAG: class I SAM-dependent methyltransferase [Deltaproteobacteria bacterium]|nr:class I SAM-dependent methyltransferase [Deltaproteobacteria bacterium]
MPHTYLDSLLKADILRKSVIQSAIQQLHLPHGSKGLDAGCGAGLQCILLAEEVGPDGHVTGLDVSPEFLAHGRDLVKQAGLEKRITLKEGSIDAIPYDDHTFDWAWSADCVGYGPWDPKPFLKELKRVIKPGGLLAILAWSSERLLPGHPLLEARLSATSPGLAPFLDETEPSRHFLRALGWLRELGLVNTRAEVFSNSVHAPLGEEVSQSLLDLFEMRWQGVEKELAKEDLDQYRRLCRPESPDLILLHPDYYAFFTYSMFWGNIPE